MLRFLIIILFSLLAVGCGKSDRERELYAQCVQSAQYLDMYDRTGDHLPKTDLGKRIISDVCNVKAELYVEGYRVSTEFYRRDVAIFQQHFLRDQSLRGLYLRSISNN